MAWRPFKLTTGCEGDLTWNRVETRWSLYKILIPLPLLVYVVCLGIS